MSETTKPQTPEATNRKGKNLVICLDGTGDWGVDHVTNVMKIFLSATQSESQEVFYCGGVGTLINSEATSWIKKKYLQLFDLATATSLRNQVLDSYEFLVDKYNPGDRIYVFGFSRGAYAARLLCSFTNYFNILTPNNKHLTPYLWQHIDGIKRIEKFKSESSKIRTFFASETHIEPPIVPIHFLGIFDTVSSVGIFDRFRVFPGTDHNVSIDHNRHAVSIQESRNAFPDLLLRPRSDTKDVVEIWFPGVHRDIGGGATKNQGYENITMNWMVSEAKKFGLEIPDLNLDSTKKESHLGGFDPYVIVGLYPMKMFDYSLQHLGQMNWSFIRLWRMMLHQDVRDLGFRWYWPNYKHFRKLPANALEYIDNGPDEGKVRDHNDGIAKTYDEVSSKTSPIPKPESTNVAQRFMDQVPDSVGITLGVALAFLIGNRGLGEPFGDSWPGHSDAWAFIFFFAYLIQQGYSHIIKYKWKKDWLNAIVPIIGVFGTFLLVKSIESWPTLMIGLASGLVIALISLGPYGKRVLHADRVVPLFMLPLLAISAGLWILPTVVQFAIAKIGAVVAWISMGHICIGTERNDVSIWWSGLHNDPKLAVYAWQFQSIALFIAGCSIVSGVLQIVQDRAKMAKLPTSI